MSLQCGVNAMFRNHLNQWLNELVLFICLFFCCNKHRASSILKSAPEMMTPNQMKLEGKNQEIVVIDNIK